MNLLFNLLIMACTIVGAVFFVLLLSGFTEQVFARVRRKRVPSVFLFMRNSDEYDEHSPFIMILWPFYWFGIAYLYFKRMARNRAELKKRQTYFVNLTQRIINKQV